MNLAQISALATHARREALVVVLAIAEWLIGRMATAAESDWLAVALTQHVALTVNDYEVASDLDWAVVADLNFCWFAHESDPLTQRRRRRHRQLRQPQLQLRALHPLSRRLLRLA